MLLDSTLAEAHTSLARFRYENYDQSRVEAGYLRAIELDPGYMEAHLMYAFYLASLGLTDGAIAELRVAIGLAPRYPLLHVWLGRLLYYARRYDESIEQYRKVIDWDSGGRPSATVSTEMLRLAHGWLGKTYLIQSMAEEAVIAFQESFRLNRYPPEAVSALAPVLYAVAGQGPVPPALRVLDAMSERRTVLSYHLAWLYLGLGETDRAFEHLEEAYEMKERMLLDLKVDPVWDPIRSDPRYLSLLRRLGLN